MSQSTSTPRAALEVAFWNGPGGERWVKEQAERDAFLFPYGDAAMRAGAPAAGESVLDVGCGCGTTLLALAALVGESGRVVGLDVSAPMLARAREVAKGRPNVETIEADPSVTPLEARAFDLLFSRFGVMFFDDPFHAFTRLGEALRPGGRLAFACWRSLADNPWAALPAQAAAEIVGAPAPAAPESPGPFAFADRSRVHAILDHAGFESIEIAPFDAPVLYPDLDHAAHRLARNGPSSRMLAERDAATVSAVVARVREVIAPFAGPDGVRVPGATWTVTARMPRV